MSTDLDDLPEAVAMSVFSARHWHSGQASALYAWASSGSAVAGLSREAANCARLAEEAAQTEEDPTELEELLIDTEALAALAAWAEEREL